MTSVGIALVAAVVVLVLLPSKWDPAIRLKEYNIKKAKELSRGE